MGLSELELGNRVEGDFASEADTFEEEVQAHLVGMEVWWQVQLVDLRMG